MTGQAQAKCSLRLGRTHTTSIYPGTRSALIIDYQATAECNSVARLTLIDSCIRRFAQSLQRPQQVATFKLFCRHASEQAPLSNSRRISLSVILLHTHTYISKNQPIIGDMCIHHNTNDNDYQVHQRDRFNSLSKLTFLFSLRLFTQCCRLHKNVNQPYFLIVNKGIGF